MSNPKQTYNLFDALRLSLELGRPIKASNPDLPQLRSTPTGVLALNFKSGQWNPLTIRELTTLPISSEWEVMINRDAQLIEGKCLGIDFTKNPANGKYLATIALELSDKIADPEFYTGRDIKISLEIPTL